MDVLVVGATGFVGRALVLRLLREGMQVTAWVRDQRKARSVLGADVRLIDGAPATSLALQNAVANSDVVINLAGEGVASRRWSTKRKQALRDSRLEPTRQLISAIETAGKKPGVLINASAIGYYGSTAEPQDEASPLGTGFLSELCRDWENCARAAESCGVRVVLLRIGVVLGPEGGALAEMSPIFRKGLGGRLGSGKQYMSWIHLDDLVECIVYSILNKAVVGPVNAIAPHPVTNADFTREFAAALGRPAFLRVPKAALKLMMGRRAEIVLADQNIVPTRLRDCGFGFRYPKLASALADLVGHSQGPALSRLRQPPTSTYLQKRGARYELTHTTVIEAPLAEVFDFFSRAENLGAVTPPALGFDIQTPSPIEIHKDAVIDYQISLGPMPMKWRTRIEAWEPGTRFVDVQERGPYRSWWHEHRFYDNDGVTIMEDRVCYAPPFSVLGWLAHGIFIRRMLQRIFGYRRFAIRWRFGAGASIGSNRLVSQLCPK